MKKDEDAKVTLRKIFAISLIVILMLGASVLAGNVKLNSVKIKFSNNHEITVVTSKTKVSQILEDNHIVVASNEEVTPAMDEDITDAKTIKITLEGTGNSKIAEASEETKTIEDIKQEYTNITEKIVTKKEEIPFKTVKKDVSNKTKNTTNKIIQYGENGIKEITYKIKYQNDVEIEKVKLSEKVIKKAKNQIVEISTKIISSRSSSRTTGTSGLSGTYKITAYCPCAICCR